MNVKTIALVAAAAAIAGCCCSRCQGNGEYAETIDEGFVSIIGRINDTIVLSSGKKINPAMIENKIKNICTDSEAAIFKTKDENSFIINIVIISESFEKMDKESVKEKISRMGEIKSFTDPYKIVFMEMDKTVLSGLYTENGKFSRKKAIDMLLSK